jgi:KDO2-lipid IV(A) lauroyltransferase
VDRALAAYKLGSGVARALPAPLASAATRAASVGASQAMRERRLMVERNLRRATGRDLRGVALRSAVQRTFESYGRYWLESFRLPGLTRSEVDAGLSYEGFEHIERARADGYGPLMAIPHLGGWEWAAFWLTMVADIPVTAVVEPIEPPELFEWFVEFRRSLGMHVVPLGPKAGAEVVRGVRARHVVCLLSDRDIQGGGIEVEFFGERTTLPGGPATLALRTGAPILPCAVYNRQRGHHCVIRPPIPVERRGSLREDVTRITQYVATELEALIRAAPEQWHLMAPNWPSDHRALVAAGLRPPAEARPGEGAEPSK